MTTIQNNGVNGVKVLIIHASGINRDPDAAAAIAAAGGQAEIKHLKTIQAQPESLANYHMLLIAGGFSYGDALGAGKRLGLELHHFTANLQEFVAAGKPVLGICNGFQVLLSMGIFGENFNEKTEENNNCHLTHNQSGTFSCRWVYLAPNPNSPSIFTKNLTAPIYCPIAHGEGRFVTKQTVADNRIALRYADATGAPANGNYPSNPNGSQQDIAALTNSQGNVLGMMPHPENHIYPWQHPRATSQTYTQRHNPNAQPAENASSGLALFKAGIAYAQKFV